MSNTIATIPASVMGEAYIQAKQMFGVELCKADRTNAKGVTTTRGALGIALSGNVDDRKILANHILMGLWTRSKFGEIVAELNRVFPALDKAITNRNANVNALLAETPELSGKVRLINTANPGKQDVMAMFGLAQQMKGADKGEKAKLLAGARVVNDYEQCAAELARDMVAKASALTAA